jgi:hypothetical protein
MSLFFNTPWVCSYFSFFLIVIRNKEKFEDTQGVIRNKEKFEDTQGVIRNKEKFEYTQSVIRNKEKFEHTHGVFRNKLWVSSNFYLLLITP